MRVDHRDKKRRRLLAMQSEAYETIDSEFCVVVRPGPLGLHLVREDDGITINRVDHNSRYIGLLQEGDKIACVDWECVEACSLTEIKLMLSSDSRGSESKTLTIKRRRRKEVSLVTAKKYMLKWPFHPEGELTPPPAYVNSPIPKPASTVASLDKNDMNKSLGIQWVDNRWVPISLKQQKDVEKHREKRKALSPPRTVPPPKKAKAGRGKQKKEKKERKLTKRQLAARISPAQREKTAKVIQSINKASGKKHDKAAILATQLLRGVTMRPSGKWQAQYYFAGKSQYIGVFDTKEKAALAYEIARETLSGIKPKDKVEAGEYVTSARKAAFTGVNDKNKLLEMKGSITFTQIGNKSILTRRIPMPKPASIETPKTPEANGVSNGNDFVQSNEKHQKMNSTDDNDASDNSLSQKLEHKLFSPGSKGDKESDDGSSDEESRSSDEGSDSDSYDDNLDSQDAQEKKQMFLKVHQYIKQHGHSNVYEHSSDDHSFCEWVDKIRILYHKQKDHPQATWKVSADEIAFLDKIGFSWTVYENPDKPKKKKVVPKFEERFEALKAFTEKYGHNDITRNSTVDGSLGRWCEDIRLQYKMQMKGNQATRRRNLTDEEISSLESIGFKFDLDPKDRKNNNATNSKSEEVKKAGGEEKKIRVGYGGYEKEKNPFDEKFQELLGFQESHGHTNVNSNYPQNPALGNWCFNVRQAYDKIKKGKRANMKLSDEEIERLNNIGFSWDYTISK